MQLITDRTESDALLRNEKGVYGYGDLNRVESAVAEIAALFPDLDINAELEVKTDWGIPGMFSGCTWPVVSQMQRYLRNIETIKKLFSVSIWTPSSMNRLTWSGANNIERALEVAMQRARGTIQAFQYSGEIFAGEE